MAFFDLNLNDTFGAYTLGTFASSILFGVTCFQTYHYFNTYSDGLFLKLTVITVSCFEMLHVSFSIHAVYHYLITDYLSPLSLLRPIWSINILFGVIAIVVLVVQLFYAWRIYIISRRKNVIIPVAITIVALTHCTSSWILVAVLFRLPSLLDLPGLPETLAKVSLSTAVAIDITIASTLTYYLHTSRTGIRQTDKLINRLMIYTINNGTLTTVFDIITLTLVITQPRDLLFLAFSQVLASLYSNSFLATLNSRRKPVATDAVVASNGLSLQTINFRAAAGAVINSDSTSSPIENGSHKDQITRLVADVV